MEKFFVIQITKTTDSDVYATGITVKENEDAGKALKDAKMLYHQILASVYSTANIDHAIVKVDKMFGNTILMETILPQPPAPEPEPNEEPEE